VTWAVDLITFAQFATSLLGENAHFVSRTGIFALFLAIYFSLVKSSLAQSGATTHKNDIHYRQ
jgi:hypothetical protein